MGAVQCSVKIRSSRYTLQTIFFAIPTHYDCFLYVQNSGFHCFETKRDVDSIVCTFLEYLVVFVFVFIVERQVKTMIFYFSKDFSMFCMCFLFVCIYLPFFYIACGCMEQIITVCRYNQIRTNSNEFVIRFAFWLYFAFCFAFDYHWNWNMLYVY